jgi:hypothetical protein
MRELLLRHHAPMVVLAFEVEAPTRIIVAADGVPELRRIAEWIEASPTRARSVADAVGDERRAAAWSRSLSRERGGVAAAMVELLMRVTRTTNGRPPKETAARLLMTTRVDETRDDRECRRPARMDAVMSRVYDRRAPVMTTTTRTRCSTSAMH